DDEEHYKQVPVCAMFVDGLTTVYAQARQLPGVNGPPLSLYVTSTVVRTRNPAAPYAQAVDALQPATIVHEAIHSLTGHSDVEMSRRFMTFGDNVQIP